MDARIDPENKRKQYFMVMSFLFQFCEDRMSSFEVMANNILANQVQAALILILILIIVLVPHPKTFLHRALVQSSN